MRNYGSRRRKNVAVANVAVGGIDWVGGGITLRQPPISRRCGIAGVENRNGKTS